MAEGKPFPLKYPPGIFRNGTEFQARGRWHNADLVRFLEKTVRPIGGWENLQAGGVDIPFGPVSVLTLTANPTDGETIVVEGKTYTFKDILTNTDGFVKIGVSISHTLDNLIAAINLSAGGFAGTGGWTDFSEYTANAQPSDWTVVSGDAGAWKVQTQAGVTGGLELQHPSSGASATSLGWDASNHPSDTEHDVLALIRAETHASTALFGISVREDGAGNLVTATLDDKNNSLVLKNGPTSTIGTFSFTINAGSYYWIRLHVTGTTVQAKIWSGVQSDEPASWDIDTIFAVDVAAGRMGVYTDWFKVGAMDVFAFVTGGDTLPTEMVRYAAATTAGNGSALSSGSTSMRYVGSLGGAVSEALASGSWSSATLINDVPRAMIGWRNDAAIAPQLAIGTNGRIYHFTQGALVDRTPSDLALGTADSEFGVGAYGSGAYGVGAYGTGDPAQGTFVEGGTWSLDTWGDFLVGVLTSDGRMLVWDGVTDTLEVIANAPTNCDALVVTAERFLFALGADGDPRLVKWPDRETLTTWTALETNEAGEFPLPGEGVLMQGLRGKSETLLFTDSDLFAARYIGGTLVYGFPKVGSACGVISRHGAVVAEGRALWMGQRGFFSYDGYVDTLESDVSDYVFSDFNRTQRAKVWGMTMSDFGEVWWFYPSAASQECDRYVIYNYVEEHWSIGSLQRSCGIDRIAFEFPMMCSTGNAMDHERGSTRIGTPFIEGGPMQIGAGGRTVDVDELIPDESVGGVQGLGSLSATLFTRMYPTDDEVTEGPFTLANPTTLRISARQIRVRIDEVVPGDWRLGRLHLNVQPGSRR